MSYPGKLVKSTDLNMSQHLENEMHLNKNFGLQKEDEMAPLLPQVQEKHQNKEALLQMLVENTFDLLALIDENGKYLYVAESAFNASKGAKDSLLGYKAS